VKKEQNGRKSLRRLKPTVGCNASKRRRRISYVLYLPVTHKVILELVILETR